MTTPDTKTTEDKYIGWGLLAPKPLGVFRYRLLSLKPPQIFALLLRTCQMKEELTNAINDDTKLSEFRQKYNIEVFKGGKTYYKHVIKDNHINGIIQRNSIYRLNINNIFNVGAQVPNGEPTENDFYYINVTVTVNPWVLNTEDVDLQ